MEPNTEILIRAEGTPVIIKVPSLSPERTWDERLRQPFPKWDLGPVTGVPPHPLTRTGYAAGGKSLVISRRRTFLFVLSSFSVLEMSSTHPCMWAKPVTIFDPYIALNSWNLLPSTTLAMTCKEKVHPANILYPTTCIMVINLFVGVTIIVIQ